MKPLLLAVLILGAATSRADDNDKSFNLIWSRYGVNGNVSAFERLRIDADDAVVWKTAARGDLCASEGGTYQGKITPELRERVAQAAQELVAEQKQKKAPPARAPRQIITRLTIERDGVVDATQIVEATPKWRALTELLDDIRAKTTPLSAIAMSVSRERDGTHVRLKLRGDEPKRLPFPTEADEVFTSAMAPVAWAHRPPKQVVQLTKEHPETTVVLKGIPANARELRYSDVTPLHHLKGPSFESAEAPEELSLCVRLGRKN